jgi:hypothetical protein
MSSPVTGSDFAIASQSQSLCERLTNLLGLSSKMKLWFDWAFDSSGDSTTSFKAMFLPPPGTILAYYLKAPEATVKAAIENLGRDSTDIADSNKTPFWVLCDGSNDTPDLRGRLIIGGGAGTGLTNRSVDGSYYGSETVTLGQSNVPTKDHYHGVGDTWTPNYDGDDDLTFIQRRWTDPNGSSWGQSVLRSVEAGSSGARNTGFIGTTNAIDVDSTNSGTVTPISIVPPAVSVWYMMRTLRVE